MTFLEDEKKRISHNYHKLMLSLFLFMYFIVIQSDISMHKDIWGRGLDAKPISIINPILVAGIIILTIHLNTHLFWIKEQGKMVLILRKYDMIPLSKKEMYSSKIKIIINNQVTFLVISTILYIVSLLMNSYFEINIIKNIWELVQMALLSMSLIIIILITNLMQDKKTKNEI